MSKRKGWNEHDYNNWMREINSFQTDNYFVYWRAATKKPVIYERSNAELDAFKKYPANDDRPRPYRNLTEELYFYSTTRHTKNFIYRQSGTCHQILTASVTKTSEHLELDRRKRAYWIIYKTSSGIKEKFVLERFGRHSEKDKTLKRSCDGTNMNQIMMN